ncbi:hypothetical protein IFM12275_29710 [Nocardia sputorum]|uniref:Uncharacterized protein n=1 Tax=Nocardia sputorum TaxID=2984338 RepID=A0ABN6UED8_9NOCA|nr:hypothetical protein IFM12275_29710 [Nocardia sputorum]BDU03678.1 hypothetical protein IFM12276_67060 [Nocardia sputorum]
MSWGCEPLDGMQVEALRECGGWKQIKDLPEQSFSRVRTKEGAAT